MPMDLSFAPFSGVGVVTLYKRDANGAVTTAGWDMGEASALKLSTKSPSAEMNTSRDVSRGTAFRWAQSKTGGVEITCKTLHDQLLALLTGGTWTDVAAAQALASWAAPTVEVNQVVRLPGKNYVSITSVVDSSGTPKTLAASQYDVDLVAGTIKFKDITTGGAYVQPFKVTAPAGNAYRTLGALKASDSEYLLTFAGTNSVDGKRVALEAYRIRFDGENDQDWITEDAGTYTLKGGVLKDDTRQASDAGGQFYAIHRPS